MVTFYMLQAGYIDTVIYSCLATVKTFFHFFHSKQWESNKSMKQTFTVVDVYSQKIQYTKMQELYVTSTAKTNC